VINEYRLGVRKAEQEIVELNESQLNLNALRVGKISEIISWITKLEQETSNEKDHIRILQSELDSKQWPWYLFSRGSSVRDEFTMLGDIDFPRRSGRESKILEMFYQGNDLVTISSATEVEPGEIFRCLQRPFVVIDHSLLKVIDLPPDWRVDRDRVIHIIESWSFLFSLTVFDNVFSIHTIQDLARVLTIAFEDYRQFPDGQWQLMVGFVLELAFSSIVYDRNRDSLEEEITRLRSMRGKLTRRCRTLKKESADELSECHTMMHQLRSLVADQEK
jgi:hypothetical protein